MKTTLEIPDAIFRRAKARAAEQRVPLRQFVSEAVAEKLEAEISGPAKGEDEVGRRPAPFAQGDGSHQRLD